MTRWSESLAAELATLPDNARAALALALAERALDAQHFDEETALPFRTAIDRAWAWLEGEPVPGASIYEPVSEMVELESAMGDGPGAAAAVAVENAVHYVCWNAFSREVAAKKIAVETVPGELLDMGEHVIGEVIDGFGEAGGMEQQARAVLCALLGSPHAKQVARGVRELLAPPRPRS